MTRCFGVINDGREEEENVLFDGLVHCGKYRTSRPAADQEICRIFSVEG